MAQLDDDAQGAVERVADASGACIVKLSGEIDIFNADRLGIRRIIECTGLTDILPIED